MSYVYIALFYLIFFSKSPIVEPNPRKIVKKKVEETKKRINDNGAKEISCTSNIESLVAHKNEPKKYINLCNETIL